MCGEQHSNPGERDRGTAGTAVPPRPGSRPGREPSTNCSRISLKVEDKKKCILRAVLNQLRRNLPFGFIKRLIKNIEKFSSLFIFFPQEEFGSSLENCVTLERALGSQPAAGRRQMLQAVWGPAHTRPNSEHKQWPEVGCNFFFLF